MSLSRAEIEAMDRDELIETVVGLSQTVENHQAAQNRLFSKLDDMVDRIDELEQELSQTRDTLHKERGKVTRRVAALEDEVGISAHQATAIAEAGSDGPYMTKLQRLIRQGPGAVVETPSATHRRAKTLIDNWHRWGEKASVDRDSVTGETHGVETWKLNTNAHDLKTRLEDARGESLQWTQVYRAMETIADWSEGAARLKDDTDGKTLVIRQEVDP